MQRPKINKQYVLVRISEGEIHLAQFERFDDGSASVEAEGTCSGCDDTPDAWKEALMGLRQRGYLWPEEAKAAGLLPPDWHPA